MTQCLVRSGYSTVLSEDVTDDAEQMGKYLKYW
jgi:hypothetical protein